MDESFNAVIERVYESANFPGLAALVKLVQKENPSITKSYITKWHDNQLEVQLLHSQHKTTHPGGHVVAYVKNEIWNIEIFDLSKYASENSGMKYIFAVVDVFTRKAYAEPMTKKAGTTALEPCYLSSWSTR